MNVEKLKNKARKFELKDQPAKAIEVYLEIIKGLEGSTEIEEELALFNKVGDLYLKEKDVNSAVEMYERAVNRYTESGFPNNAIALCNKILRSAPSRTHVYLKLAQLMLQRGFVAEAKKNFVEYAQRMSEAGKLDEAFNALKKFADISPENEEIRLMLAEQLKAAARDDEAREQIEKLITESGASERASGANEVLEKVRAVDPEYDVENAEPESADRASGLVYISLDDEAEAAAAPEPAGLETMDPPSAPEDVAPLDIETSSLDNLDPAGAGVDTDGLELERTPELEDGPSGDLQGLETGAEFAAPSAGGDGGLDIERTSADDGLAFDSGSELEAPGTLTPVGDLDTSVSDTLGTGTGELDMVEVPDLEAAGASDLDVPDLDLDGFDESPGEQLITLDSDDAISDVTDVDFRDTGELPSPAPRASESAIPAEFGVDIELTDEHPTPPVDEIEDISDTTIPALADEDLEEVLPPIEEAEEDDEVLPPIEGIDDEEIPEAELPELEEVPDEPASSPLDQLTEQLAEDPGNIPLRRRYAEVLIENGDRDGGLSELDRVLDGYEREEDWSSATAVADLVLRLEPGSVSHYQRRVEYAYRGGDRGQLIQAYLDLAGALFRSGSLDNARSIYERVLDTDPENQAAKEALTTLAPAPDEEEVEAVAAAAPAEGDANFVDLSDFIFGDDEPVKDTRMQVEGPEPESEEQADFDEMLAQFKRGIEENLDEEDSQAHYDLGVAFKEMGLVDEAISEFQKSLRAADTRLQSAEMLGMCFFDKGQIQVAATVLKRAVDGDPSGDHEKIGLLYWLGRCLEEQNRTKDALQNYERVLAIDIHFQDVGQRVDNIAQAESGK